MNAGVGSLSLLQGIFPTQELNGGLLLCSLCSLYSFRKKAGHFSLVYSSFYTKPYLIQSFHITEKNVHAFSG